MSSITIKKSPDDPASQSLLISVETLIDDSASASTSTSTAPLLPITSSSPPLPLSPSSSTSLGNSHSPSSPLLSPSPMTVEGFPAVVLPFNTDFYEIRKTILDLPPKDTYTRIFASQKDLEIFLLYISDAFKKKGSGKRNLTCQCNETKSTPPTKKQATPATIGDLGTSSPSRNRKSKLIPKSQQCEASLKIDKDPNVARITVTAHTCSKQFPKFPKFLTDAIDRLLEVQLGAGSSPPVARSVINAQIRNSILISLASQSGSLTKHINNRCMKLIKPPPKTSPVRTAQAIPVLSNGPILAYPNPGNPPASSSLSSPTSTQVPDLSSDLDGSDGSNTSRRAKRTTRPI